MGTATSIQRIASLDANSLFAVCSNILRGSGSKSRYCDSAVDPAARKKGKRKNDTPSPEWIFIYAPESFVSGLEMLKMVSLYSLPFRKWSPPHGEHVGKAFGGTGAGAGV